MLDLKIFLHCTLFPWNTAICSELWPSRLREPLQCELLLEGSYVSLQQKQILSLSLSRRKERRIDKIDGIFQMKRAETRQSIVIRIAYVVFRFTICVKL